MRKIIGVIAISLGITAVLLFATPQSVQAGCLCQPKSSVDYKSGVWVSDGNGACNLSSQECKDCWNLPGASEASCASVCANSTACDPLSETSINPGFQVPTFSTIMGSLIRLIFFMAGLIALVFLLLGGLGWVQSAGEEKKVEAAQKKITASVIGLVVMIAVLSLVIFLEQVVFGGKFCLGISCPMNISFLQLIR